MKLPRAIWLVVATMVLAGCSKEAQPSTDRTAGERRCSLPSPTTGINETILTVYFTCGDDSLPAKPRPVPRKVPSSDSDFTTAVLELLKGPSESERATGLWSWFSDQTAGMLNSVVVTPEGRAIVDFKNFSAVIPNASTSAGMSVFLSESGYTIAQFPAVKEIEYRFDGSCDAFWYWLQSECHVVPVPE